MAAIQKANRTVLNVFIMLIPFYAFLYQILCRIAGEASAARCGDLAQGPLKKAAVAAQRILQEKKEVRPIRRLTSPVGRTPS